MMSSIFHSTVESAESGWLQESHAKWTNVGLETDLCGFKNCSKRYMSNELLRLLLSFIMIAIHHYLNCPGATCGCMWMLDTCGGDSGGPLMQIANTQNGPKYFLTGIVSYGPSQCGLYPALYTRTSFYLPFIKGFMWKFHSGCLVLPKIRSSMHINRKRLNETTWCSSKAKFDFFVIIDVWGRCVVNSNKMITFSTKNHVSLPCIHDKHNENEYW